jgi:hypothetical protein
MAPSQRHNKCRPGALPMLQCHSAMPIVRRDDGAIPTDDAVECPSPEAAVECAQQMSACPITSASGRSPAADGNLENGLRRAWSYPPVR